MDEHRKEHVNILLVEDNEAHAEIVIRYLRKHELHPEIHHAADGRQALDYLFNQGAYADPVLNPRPVLVLLDLRLPRIDGLEVLRTVKTTPGLLRIPIVILTSSDAETDIVSSYECHANSYLVKPSDFKAFITLMTSLIEYWVGYNVPPPAD